MCDAVSLLSSIYVHWTPSSFFINQGCPRRPPIPLPPFDAPARADTPQEKKTFEAFSPQPPTLPVNTFRIKSMDSSYKKK